MLLVLEFRIVFCRNSGFYYAWCFSGRLFRNERHENVFLRRNFLAAKDLSLHCSRASILRFGPVIPSENTPVRNSNLGNWIETEFYFVEAQTSPEILEAGFMIFSNQVKLKSFYFKHQ